ncbi:MAG: glycerol-3-phosphate dehydrogenase/oxidase [Acidobacteriota bacterium]|nr:glycerol-3-phosphate dehydrogenase/oxidase [Acidobacteriota bacterium]
MTRDVSRLTAEPFDLLVVGGGIHGLTIAYDAAQRGLRVALVERGDLGSGSSFNHQKTAHGGLRYLQSADLARARESVLERRALARIAPHLVHPLAFVLPVYRSLTSGATALRAGFLLDRLVAWDRNAGVPAALRLPAGRVISPAQTLARFPGVRRLRLTGAGVWYDYQMADAERLTLAFARAAAGHGAVLANYVEAEAPLREGGRIAGMRVRDRRTGATLDVAARVTLNAAGAGAGLLMQGCGVDRDLPLLQAMNLVTSRDAASEALGAKSPSGRHLFLVPWRGRALIGTWESPATCEPDAVVGLEQVEAFRCEVNQTFPAFDLAADEITLVHRGVVPADVAPDGRLSLRGHHEVRDHQQDGADGLVTVIGVKYTTARKIAEEAVDLVMARLERPAVASRTARTPLPGGERPDVDLLIEEARRALGGQLPVDVVPHLVHAYGTRYQAIVQLMAERPGLAERLPGPHPVMGAELVYAVRHEMVCTLTDAVVRRTGMGAAGYPGHQAAAAAAAIVAGELEWDADRTAAELQELKEFYRPLPATAP